MSDHFDYCNVTSFTVPGNLLTLKCSSGGRTSIPFHATRSSQGSRSGGYSPTGVGRDQFAGGGGDPLLLFAYFYQVYLYKFSGFVDDGPLGVRRDTALASLAGPSGAAGLQSRSSLSE